MAWWAWLLIGIALILSESITPVAFYLLFFGVSACILSILLGLGVVLSAELQWVLFSLIAVIFIATLRRLLVKPGSHENGSSDISSPIGEIGLCLSSIPPGGDGHVELRGAQWAARNTSSHPIAAHARVRVTAMNGLTLEIAAEK